MMSIEVGGRTMSDPTYEQLQESEAEMRYEAGMYHSLYDLWEKRANSYQAMMQVMVRTIKAWEAFGDCQTDEKMNEARAFSESVRRLWDGANHSP